VPRRTVLFTSPNIAFAPGRVIRGGIPIIFPWFGASRHAPAAPQHGFARTAPWHLDRVETAGRESLTLTFSLGDGDVGSPFWPEPFRAIYTVVFAQTLSLRLAVQNRATHPIIFEEALCTYFAISDITGIAISWLAGTTYIDKRNRGLDQPVFRFDEIENAGNAEFGSNLLDLHRSFLSPEIIIADCGAAAPSRNSADRGAEDSFGSRAAVVAGLTVRPVCPQLRKCRVRRGSYAWCHNWTLSPTR